MSTPTCSPLHLAAQHGDVAALERLLAEGATVDAREREPLEKIPSMLLAEGEDTVLASGFSFCRTPLMLSALHGHLPSVELLLRAGADIKLKDAAGRTSLLLACRSGHLEVAKSLVAAGADLKVKGPGKRAAIHLASESGHADILDWLLDQGSKPDLKDGCGNTPLLLACTYGHLEAVDTLLQHGADPQLGSRDGRSPLAAVLATSKRIKIPKSEAFKGGYLSVQWTDDGVFASVPMDEERLRPLVSRLLQAGAEVNPASPSPPLTVAAQSGHAGLVRLLLEAGACPNARSVIGQTALEVAIMFSRSDVVTVLEKVTMAVEPAAIVSEAEQPDRWGSELPLPDFRQGNTAAGVAVKELANRLGQAQVKDLELFPGAFELRVDNSWEWPEKLEVLQAEFALKGLFVFEPDSLSQAPHRLIALPTEDRYQALLVMGTNGVNYGVGPGYIITWLKNLESRQPFSLLAVGHDLVAGRFLTAIAQPELLAQEMYDLCPDLVEQGAGSVEELADEVLERNQLFLWWD